MNKVFKALSDPTRRRVLGLLREKPMTAGELAEHFEVSKPTMSAHFSVLREADLIDAEKVGRVITYHLRMSVLEEAMFGFASVFGLEVKATDTEQTTTETESKANTEERA
jgi:DNA-binding transcriptional ArsR family regulator